MVRKRWPACGVCGRPVSTSDGILTIMLEELNQQTEAIQRWEEEHYSGRPMLVPQSNILVTEPMTLREVLSRPDYARWQWGHRECLPDGMIHVEAAEFDTLGKALDWTLNMWDRAWIGYSDWPDTVRRLHNVPDA